MRAFLIALACVAATSLGAQMPAAPTAPASAKPSSSRGEFRVSGFTINGDRSFDFNNTVANETGSVKGVEVLLRAKFAGLMVRSMTGEFGTQPHVTSADARILLFPPVFTIMVGAGRRALWSDLNATSPSQYDIGLAGVSSTVAIGGSGLRTNLSAAVFAPVAESQDKLKGGLEGEASILYRLPKVPLFLQLGYRTELFTTKAGTRETPEEVRGIKLGGGLQLGGR